MTYRRQAAFRFVPYHFFAPGGSVMHYHASTFPIQANALAQAIIILTGVTSGQNGNVALAQWVVNGATAPCGWRAVNYRQSRTGNLYVR